MNTQPILPRPLGTTVVAAALSFLITIGLFSGVTVLMLREGTPLQNVIIAERACNNLAFVSEREACMRSFLARAYDRHIASR